MQTPTLTRFNDRFLRECHSNVRLSTHCIFYRSDHSTQLKCESLCEIATAPRESQDAESQNLVFTFQLITEQSWVKIFLLSFENRSQNVPLHTPKLYNCATFQPAIPKTWKECFYTKEYMSVNFEGEWLPSDFKAVINLRVHFKIFQHRRGRSYRWIAAILASARVQISCSGHLKVALPKEKSRDQGGRGHQFSTLVVKGFTVQQRSLL